jgi:hypothetical protein
MTPALPVSPVSDNDMVVAWSMMMKGERGLDVCRSQGSGLLSLSDGPHPARGLIRAPNFWSRVLVGNGKKKGEASLPPAGACLNRLGPTQRKVKEKQKGRKRGTKQHVVERRKQFVRRGTRVPLDVVLVPCRLAIWKLMFSKQAAA